VPECQKTKKGGLDQYGPGHFKVQPFDTGLERVNAVGSISDKQSVWSTARHQKNFKITEMEN